MAKQAARDPAGKRIPLMVRTTAGLRAKLDEAAEASGRSLAQETELRLERSFEFQQILENVQSTVGLTVREASETTEKHIINMLGGDAAVAIWLYLGRAIIAAEWETGKSFSDDEATRHDAERRILSRIPEVFRDPPPSWAEMKQRANEVSKAGSSLAALGKFFEQAPRKSSGDD